MSAKHPLCCFLYAQLRPVQLDCNKALQRREGLWCLQILPCYKRYCHDWTICPFAHPGQSPARRCLPAQLCGL